MRERFIHGARVRGARGEGPAEYKKQALLVVMDTEQGLEFLSLGLGKIESLVRTAMTPNGTWSK